MSRMRARLAACMLGIAMLPAPGVSAAPAPTDPLYGHQWGLRQIRAEEAWERSTGEDVVIAIVDSGIDLDHPDLLDNTIPGISFANCGESGCGNGDWQSPPAGTQSHGTHVAGIAGAVRGNGLGIAGVAPDADLLAVRVTVGTSATRSDFGWGIRWAVDHGADVINVSLADLPGAQALVITGDDPLVTGAIAYAHQHGVVVIAGAGNDALSLCGVPSWIQGVLCVASTTRDEATSFFSNFPVKPDMLAVAAPGGLNPGLQFYTQGVPALCGHDTLSTIPQDGGISAMRSVVDIPTTPPTPTISVTSSSQERPRQRRTWLEWLRCWRGWAAAGIRPSS